MTDSELQSPLSCFQSSKILLVYYELKWKNSDKSNTMHEDRIWFVELEAALASDN